MVSDESIIKRISGRLTCSKCLKIFNEYFNPPNISNHLCDKKYLVKRKDDEVKTIREHCIDHKKVEGVDIDE